MNEKNASPSGGVQLPMNFGGQPAGNRFKKNLDSAVFSLLFEVRTPSADADLDSAVAMHTPLRDFVSSRSEIPCGLAFTDANADFKSYPIVKFASALAPENRDSHLLYLTGRGRSAEEIEGILAHCGLEGFRNIVCVSGRPSSAGTAPGPRVFESVRMLKANSLSHAPLFAGAAVNPFKYEMTATLAQYFKLGKKIRSGAGFAVAQFGWDARKMQEMLWQLYRCGFSLPVLSRVLILTPGTAEEICAGKHPGIHFSRDFQRAVRGEMQHSIVQFEAAQWRRLQLHAAGMRFLGCSGLQIGGIQNAAAAKTAYQMILEAFSEFKTPEDWLQANDDYYSRMELAPYPHRFYLFDNLLKRGVGREHARIPDCSVPKPSAGELFRHRLAKALFSKSDKSPASERRLSKKLIVSCRGCGKCRLPENLYVCPETCPRSFANGPCGEVGVAGGCPFSGRECVHAGKVRLAMVLRDFTALEETVV